MKLYRMMNGDIVTDIHVSTKRANAIKATRLYDAGKATYCCDTRVYYDGVDHRMKEDAIAVMLNQLNKKLRSGKTEVEVGAVNLSPLTRELNRIKGMMSRVQASSSKLKRLIP